MHLFLILVSFSVMFGLVSYYIWYLTWPVVEGEVKKIDRFTSKGIGINRPKKFRIVVYRYTFRNVEYSSRRQGLLTKFGFSPAVQVGEKIRVSVCVGLPNLSCPRRPLFELFVLTGFSLICLSCALVFYWHGYIYTI